MSEVEFVGGHAVEQTEETHSDVPENENREAAKKAVREALAAESKAKKKESKEDSEETESRPAKKPVKEVGPAETDDQEDPSEEDVEEPKPKKKDEHPDKDEDEESLRKVLKNRQKIAKEKAKAAEESQRQYAQLAQKEAQLRQLETQLQEQARNFQRLRDNPVEAVRQAGWDPEAFILDLAQSGTPEGQQAAQLRQMNQQIQEQKAFNERLIEQQRQFAQQQREQAEVNHRNSIEGRFLKAAFGDEKKTPHITSFYKGREAALIFEGDVIAANYRQLTGKECEPEDIAEYLEEQLASSATAWYEAKQKQAEALRKQKEAEEEQEDVEVVEEVRPASGVKRKANKTLSNSDSSERRSIKKNLADLDDEELKEVAKQNVRLAISKARAPRE